jgi:hypothetical protein
VAPKTKTKTASHANRATIRQYLVYLQLKETALRDFVPMRIKCILQKCGAYGTESRNWQPALDKIVLNDPITSEHFAFLKDRWRSSNPTHAHKQAKASLLQLVSDCRDKLQDLTKAAGYKWPPEEVAMPTAGGAVAAPNPIHKKRKLNTREAAVD